MLDVDMKRENEQLREEVRQLKNLFLPVMWFPAGWKLTPAQTRILRALYGAPCGYLSREAMHVAVSEFEPTTNQQIVSTQVCQLRGKLSKFGVKIENVFGEGYRLVEGREFIGKSIIDDDANATARIGMALLKVQLNVACETLAQVLAQLTHLRDREPMREGREGGRAPDRPPRRRSR